MATTLEEVVVKIGADVSALSQGMSDGVKTIADATSKMEQATSQFAQNSSGHFFNFSHAAETALGVFEGEALIEGVKKLGEIVVDVFKEMTTEAIDAASKQEDAITRLNVALGSAGQYTKETSVDFQEFAHSIQNSTKYSEESVIQAGALIETFGKLDKEGLQRATNAAVNLAAATGKDLNTAALLVGKAAEGNVTQFARWGIEVEEGSTKAETFANALKAIEAMGNVASGQAQTYSGALALLNHSWEDVQKQLGGAVVGNQAVIEVMRELSKIVADVADYIKYNQQTIKEWVADGIVIALSAVHGLVDGLEQLDRAIEVVAQVIALPFRIAIASMEATAQALTGNFSKAMETLKSGTESAAQQINVALTQKMGLTTVAEALGHMQDAAVKGFAAVKNGAESTIAPINQAKKATEEWTAEELKLGDAGAKIYSDQQKQDPAKKYQADVAALKAADAQNKITDQQYAEAVKKLDKDMAAQKQSDRETEISSLLKQNEDMRVIDAAGNADRIASNQAKINALMAQEDQYSTFALNTKKKEVEDQQRMDKARIDAAKTALGDLATFQNAKSHEMASVGKAAAIAQTTISTYQGATQAFTAMSTIPIVGPALGIAAAAAAIAAGIGNIAQIEGTPLATGIDSVPGIGSADNFPAILAPGERVTDASTNSDLKGFISSNSSNSDLLKQILQTLQQMMGQDQQPISVKVDGRTLVTALRDQIRQGRNVFA